MKFSECFPAPHSCGCNECVAKKVIWNAAINQTLGILDQWDGQHVDADYVWNEIFKLLEEEK